MLKLAKILSIIALFSFLLVGCTGPEDTIAYGEALDINGNGVPGAVVTLWSNSLLGGWSRISITDENGCFKVNVPSPPPNAVAVRKEGLYFLQVERTTSEIGAVHKFIRINFTAFPVTSSIQTEIDAAADGDTIYITPGTYNENIDFRGKAITVTSVDPERLLYYTETIIDGAGLFGPALTFSQGETHESRLIGFTIRHGIGKLADGKTYGGGLYIHGASPEIQRCMIEACSATFGGGVYIGPDSAPRFEHTSISRNMAYRVGGGMYVEDASPFFITSSIYQNDAKEAAGGLWLSTHSQLLDADGVPYTAETLADDIVNNRPDDIVIATAPDVEP